MSLKIEVKISTVYSRGTTQDYDDALITLQRTGKKSSTMQIYKLTAWLNWFMLYMYENTILCPKKGIVFMLIKILLKI